MLPNGGVLGFHLTINYYCLYTFGGQKPKTGPRHLVSPHQIYTDGQMDGQTETDEGPNILPL